MTMTSRKVVLLATLDTKSREAWYLHDALRKLNVTINMLDISLGADDETRSDNRKIHQIETVVAETLSTLDRELSPIFALVGLGGGTGGDIILRIMRTLPIEFPKILISPLPFDPRTVAADNHIVLIPTVVDLEGLNGTVRYFLNSAAGLIAGLATHGLGGSVQAGSIGLSTLGVLRGAARGIIDRLRDRGHEVTAFHANGYGGAAFARFAREERFSGTIDMTVHEMTRIRLVGDHVSMPDRFTAAGARPRIVLPGGLNFLGLGPIEQLRKTYRQRAHYQHSGDFTHVKLSHEEMATVAKALAAELNQATGETLLILPMGGFSHEDGPGGAIEDHDLRDVAAECLEEAAIAYDVLRMESHINDPATADKAVEALQARLGSEKTS